MVIDTIRGVLVEISGGAIRWKLDEKRRKVRCMYVEAERGREAQRGLTRA